MKLCCEFPRCPSEFKIFYSTTLYRKWLSVTPESAVKESRNPFGLPANYIATLIIFLPLEELVVELALLGIKWL